MYPKILLASGNDGKLKEFQQVLAETCEIIPQATFKVPDVEETATTFVENALIKARHACRYCELPVLADDSGLEVASLQGAPGVISARYAGRHVSMAQNIDKLLENLQAVPQSDRQANFRCVLVLLRHEDDPAPIIAQGVWHVSIVTKPSGIKGFGYDPIFWVPELACTAAELPASQKNLLSHRGLALKHLLAQLQDERDESGFKT